MIRARLLVDFELRAHLPPMLILLKKANRIHHRRRLIPATSSLCARPPLVPPATDLPHWFGLKDAHIRSYGLRDAHTHVPVASCEFPTVGLRDAPIGFRHTFVQFARDLQW